jgi:hypothetical protein
MRKFILAFTFLFVLHLVSSGRLESQILPVPQQVPLTPQTQPSKPLPAPQIPEPPPTPQVPPKLKECSTETVNGDCTVTVDRNYPVASPTLQMRRDKKITVIVLNPLPFESLSLDPVSAQAVAGTDQAANFFNTALPDIKAFAAIVHQTFGIEINKAGPTDESPEVLKVIDDIQNLRDRLDSPLSEINDFVGNATTVYLQLQEIVSPLPRPAKQGSETPQRDPELTKYKTPDPWNDYPGWRAFILCELIGGDCDTRPTLFSSILSDAAVLQSRLSLINPPATAVGQPSPTTPLTPPATPPLTTLFDNAAFNAKATATEVDIQAIPTDKQALYRGYLSMVVARKSAFIASLPYYLVAIPNITKDLGIYLVNISQVEGKVPRDQPKDLGELHDPRVPSTKGACATKLLGCQVSFSVNAVNEVGTLVASVPQSAQKKSIVTITVLYADPRFEVSAGAFFSTLPDRSFSNQTTVTQNPGGSPTQGNVVITQTIQRPTIVPFVGANYRLGSDWAWPGRRRGAFYLTGAVGLNPYNTTAEFGVGPSISWRSLMFSPLFHLGHDVRLTQGEFVGEIWCNQSGANSAVPKCSGPPPAPTTKKVWTSAFAFAISVRVPSVFGGGGSSGSSSGGGH